MQPSAGFSIRQATPLLPSDAELESILHQVYVGEGFTTEELATKSMSAPSVRDRGQIFIAVKDESKVVGTVILVTPGSPAQRLSSETTEAELHLLAVLPEFRKLGLGRALISEALARARTLNNETVILWTQPAMKAAHRLYLDLGFEWLPARNFQEHGREFLVMRIEL